MNFVVHIIADLSKINFGVWNSALFATHFLNQKYTICSFLVVCQEIENEDGISGVPVLLSEKNPDTAMALSAFADRGMGTENTIIVTHGCWLRPTRLGYGLRQHGYKWIYTPHGMLEPWSLAHHRWKKKVYYHLLEKHFIRKADAVRAVSKAEQANLERLLNRSVVAVENGVKMPAIAIKPSGTFTYLFMARLHKKKGILPLVMAWDAVMRDSGAKLIIAGPDEGELEKIRPYVNGNILYAGAVYGSEKEELLRQSHYYLLPSFSEGFPTSVVEAMSYGLIPLISEGCNFPEVFVENLGYRITPDVESISGCLRLLKNAEFDERRSLANYRFIQKNYSEEVIGEKLFAMYSTLM